METNETQVLMKTNLGNIKLKLYNETSATSRQLYQTGKGRHLQRPAFPPCHQGFHDPGW